MSFDLKSILDTAKGNISKTASADSDTSDSNVADLVKMASAEGAAKGDNFVKMASAMGDILGDRAFDGFLAKVASSLGYSPEVTKVASLNDMLEDTMVNIMTKIAESVQGTSGAAVIGAQESEEAQIDELAAHHATQALLSAADVQQSLQGGDHLTAGQQMNSAVNNLEKAHEFAARTSNPAVHAQVQQATQVVTSLVPAEG